MALNTVNSGLPASSVATGRAGSVGTPYAGGTPASIPPSLAATPASGAPASPSLPYAPPPLPQAQNFATSRTVDELQKGGLDQLASSPSNPTNQPFPAADITPPPPAAPPATSNVGSYARIGVGAALVGVGIWGGGWWWLLAGGGALLAVGGITALAAASSSSMTGGG